MQELVGRDGDPPASWIVGTTDEVAERLRDYAQAGCDGAYLQHLVHEDLETVELIGRGLAPLVADVASQARAPTRSATSCATSVGVVPTVIPTASSAAFFASAVPDVPEMIAPA